MPKDKGECPCFESQIGARPPVGGPMEISPEAYELLRNASIPSEFKEVVREVIPNVAMPYPPDLESRATSSEIDMTSVEMPILRVSIPPVEMPVPSVPVSWPEMSTADRVVNTFHLTDLTLDLSGVVHMTPGLHDLALSTLAPIVLNLPALWGTGQLYFFQDGPPPDGEEEEDDDVAEPPKTCDTEFVSDRRSRDWYRNNGFGEKLKCPETRTKTIPGTKSLPIYCAIAGAQWTEAEVREKFEKARVWFSRYCISLRIKEVPLQQDESGQFSTALARTNAQGQAQYESQVRKIYEHLWNNRMGRPRGFLLLLFVDPFNKVAYDRVEVDTSGNFADIPVILITSADKASSHIVTHELVHGLGKGIIRGSPPRSIRWVDAPNTSAPESVANGNNTWLEGGCREEMGNAVRRSSSVPLMKSDTAPMDWASYIQYLKLSKSIRPTS